MKAIYKYMLHPYIKMSLPTGAEILSVAEQRENIVVYALVNTTADDSESHEFVVLGTGHEATRVTGFNFIGTVNLSKGALMFHVFHRKI